MKTRQETPARALVAEFLGTALLLAAVVGSGIMGDRLSEGNTAIALLANSLATGAALVVLILTFGPLSGGHFNPVVSLVTAVEGRLSWPGAARYMAAQTSGAAVGVVVATLMFDESLFALSHSVRGGMSQVFSEFVATFGLISVVCSGSRTRPSSLPFAVGAYITAAYWFTASTSFANPAVTIARTLTDTFAGIRPADVSGFVAAQLLGAAAGMSVFRWLMPSPVPRSGETFPVSSRTAGLE